MTEITKIDSHIEDAINRLITQYRGKDNFETIVDAITEQWQFAEDGIFGLIIGRAVATSEGAQLDRLGELVGVARQSFDDDFYRILIYVQIGINTSEGEAEKLINIFKLLTEASQVHYINLNGGHIQLNTNGVILPDQVNFVFANMERVAAGGVRIDHIVCYDDNSFTFSGPNADAGGEGFGDSNDALIGGEFPILHVRINSFAFDGSDLSSKGFSTLEDPLVGGNLQGLGG